MQVERDNFFHSEPLAEAYEKRQSMRSIDSGYFSKTNKKAEGWE